ncbi:MAG: SAF domain-containing protein [Ilumatobacteraceae bacterium]
MAERLVVAPSQRVSSESERGIEPSRRRSNGRRDVDAQPVTPKRSFRLPEVVIGVMLVAGCALAAVLWQQHTNTTETVVVAARSIARGTVVTAADLGGAQIGGETSALITGDQASILLGQIAVVDIPVGSPLSMALVTDEQPLGADEALTSMALEPGQMPPDLAPNDHVRIIVTASAGATGVASTQLLESEAVVWSVELSQDGVSTVVTVRGPLTLSTDVAAAVAVRLARVDG